MGSHTLLFGPKYIWTILKQQMQFTIEKEKDNDLSFPDPTVMKQPGKLNFSIYRKPTTDIY